MAKRIQRVNCEDWRIFLSTKVEPKSVGLLLTDSPYGITTGKHDIALSRKEQVDFAAIVKTKLTPTGSLWFFCCLDDLEGWRSSLYETGWRVVRVGVWVKSNANNRVSGNGYAKGSLEFWIHATPRSSARKERLLPFMVSSVTGGKPKPHEREQRRSSDKFPIWRKPISLLRQVIINHSEKGDLVVDPFCGSGSSGVAGLLEGRKVILNDIDREKVLIAKDNLKHYKAFEPNKPNPHWLRNTYDPEAAAEEVARRNKENFFTKRKKRRSKWSLKDKDAILKILLEHQRNQLANFDHYVVMVEEAIGRRVKPPALRSLSYRLAKEVGLIEGEKLKIPSGAYDALASVQDIKERTK